MKKKLGLILAGVLVISAITVSTSFSTTDFFDFGQEVKKASKVKESTVIAKLDKDIKLTKKELDMTRLSMENNAKKKISNKEALNELIKKKVLLSLAKDTVTVTEEEFTETINFFKESFDHPDVASQINDYLNGLGMTKEQFFNDPEILQIYKDGLYIGKYRETIIDSLNVSAEKRYSIETMDKVESIIDDLVKNSHVEIIDHELIK